MGRNRFRGEGDSKGIGGLGIGLGYPLLHCNWLGGFADAFDDRTGAGLRGTAEAGEIGYPHPQGHQEDAKREDRQCKKLPAYVCLSYHGESIYRKVADYATLSLPEAGGAAPVGSSRGANLIL
jgi:hypothetical protein